MILALCLLLAVATWGLLHQLVENDRRGTVWAGDAYTGALTVRVSRHAEQRAKLRHGLGVYDVTADVAQAIRDYRYGPDLTARKHSRDGAVFAWTHGYDRVYVVQRRGRSLSVVTVLEHDEQLAGEATDTSVGRAFREAAARARLAP